MKNIVFLNSCPVWGGGEKWTFTTAKALAEDPEFNVYIATGKNTELFKRAKKAGLKTHEVNIKSGVTILNPFKAYKFVKFLKHKNIDIMFLNMSQDLKFGGVTGKIANLDKVIYRRGLAVPIKDRFYNKFLFNYCLTDVIANSIAVKNSLLKNTSNWFESEKISLLYNGVDIAGIMKKSKDFSADLRTEFSIGPEDIVIANVGRLTRQKGHRYLLDAIELIKRKKINFKLLIIGSGELESELKKKVKDLNLENFVIFTGFRDDVYKIINQSDFLVHTALWEGCPNTLLESMALGTPIVATNIDSVNEIMDGEKIGLLAEKENAADIANKIIEMINVDRTLFSENAKKLSRKKFSFKKMIKDLKKIL